MCRSLFDSSEKHTLLKLEFVKDPLTLAVVESDSQRRNVVTWCVYVTIQAEEFNISSTNIEKYYEDERPIIRRFLGIEGSFGADLGVRNDFALAIIQTVGNYKEIYNHN